MTFRLAAECRPIHRDCVERETIWRILNLCVGYRTDMLGMGKYPLFQLKGGGQK